VVGYFYLDVGSFLQVKFKTASSREVAIFLQKNVSARVFRMGFEICAEVMSDPFTEVSDMVKSILARPSDEAAARADHDRWYEQLRADELKRGKQATVASCDGTPMVRTGRRHFSQGAFLPEAENPLSNCRSVETVWRLPDDLADEGYARPRTLLRSGETDQEGFKSVAPSLCGGSCTGSLNASEDCVVRSVTEPDQAVTSKYQPGSLACDLSYCINTCASGLSTCSGSRCLDQHASAVSAIDDCSDVTLRAEGNQPRGREWMLRASLANFS
jgi:hypothetical protein